MEAGAARQDEDALDGRQAGWPDPGHLECVNLSCQAGGIYSYLGPPSHTLSGVERYKYTNRRGAHLPARPYRVAVGGLVDSRGVSHFLLGTSCNYMEGTNGSSSPSTTACDYPHIHLGPSAERAVCLVMFQQPRIIPGQVGWPILTQNETHA